MKKILVLCLTRFGDLIQTTPLLRGLRRDYPDALVNLAVLSRFKGILPLMKGFDNCFEFDKDEAARRIADGIDPLEAYQHMESFVALLERDHYDLVINLTCDRMSAYLLSATPAVSYSGLVAAGNDQRVIKGAWGNYLYSATQAENRKLNRINLVDIFSRLGGVKPDGLPVELHETTAGRDFAERFISEQDLAGTTLVGLQMGASDAVRCWPLESFARLSDLLQSRPGVRTVLFGSPGEKALADRAAARMERPPINMVGATGIQELFSLVKRCSILVTNDTGTMHFAAAGGTPAVMLSVGPAFFYGTGPYSAGNLALQPRIGCSPCRYDFVCTNPLCSSIITVDAVHAACRFMLGEPVNPAEDFTGVGVYRSRFAADGFLEWESLCNDDERQSALSKHYERVWKAFLGENTAPPPRPFLAVSAELKQLTGQGMDLTARITKAARQKPVPVKQLSDLGDREAAVEAGIKRLGECSPELAPVVDYLTLLRESINDDRLQVIAQQTHDLYRQGHRLASLL